MTAPLFRLDPLPDEPRLVLAGDEGRHAAAVRRLRTGERIDLTDGAGTLAECIVETTGRDRLEVLVQHRQVTPAPAPRLVVVQALVKGERSELAVELLTEVGIDEVVPWEAERCVARWSPERSPRRWNATAESAAKQARRVHWPRVGDVARQADVIARIERAALGLVLSESAVHPLSAQRARLPVDGEIVVVVGPEGGITPAEVDAFRGAGALPVLLGPNVLRASTAGAAAAAVLLTAAGRW